VVAFNPADAWTTGGWLADWDIAAAFLKRLVAGDAQHIEFADEIAEDGCAVAGHHTSPDGLILGCTVLFQ
jgi:hypothetical protein